MVMKNDYVKLILALTLMKPLVIVPVYIISGSDFFTLITTRWDSILYETIASEGYVKQCLFAFPPVYPEMIKSLYFVVGSYNLSAFIVTNILGYVFPIIVSKTFDFKTALAVELFPVYVLYSTIPYSDVIYLTLLALTFYFIKTRKTLFSSLTMGLAIITFYSIAWTLPSFIVRLKKDYLKFLPIPLLSGILILAWYKEVTGNPFYYFSLEKEIWGVEFTTPWGQASWILNGWFTDQPWKILSIPITPLDWFIRNLAFEVFFITLAILLIKVQDEIKWLYFTYSLFAIVPLLLVIGTPAISVPRLLLSAFPVFYSLRIRRYWWIAYIVPCVILTPFFTMWQIYAFFS
ncbi:hypothetical protein WIW90_06305 [Sulfolobaceae archaeon RB850M]|jgi:hypothetical protein